MCDYPFFIPQVVLFANSSLFWFKVTNEHREFRNYLKLKYVLSSNEAPNSSTSAYTDPANDPEHFSFLHNP